MKKTGIVATILMALILLLVSSVSAEITDVTVDIISATEDEAYTSTLTLVGEPDEIGDDVITYALDDEPTWLSIDTDTGELSGILTEADEETFDIEFGIIVYDDDVKLGPFDASITMEGVNDAPTIDVSDCTGWGIEDQEYTCTVTAEDEEDDDVTDSLTTTKDGVTITTAGVLTWTPNDEQIGSQTVNVIAEDDDSLQGLASFTVFVRPDDVCGDFLGGSSLTIDYDIIDDDEDFYPGDNIEIEVDVENEGEEDLEDIEVEAVLYDITDGKRLDVVKSDSFDLDEDESEDNIDLILEIPTDVDMGNKFIVFISVYEDGNDEEQCDWKFEDNLDFKRKKHDISIDKIVLSPSTAKAGETVDVKVDVENVGDRDEEDVYVKVKNGEMDIEVKSELFDIDAYESGDDDEYTVTLSFTVPEDAEEGNYDLEIYVYDEDDENYDSGEEFITIFVEGTSTTTTTTTTTGTATISTEGTPTEIEAGDSFSIPVKLTNTDDEDKTYTVTVSNIGDWATTTSEIEAFLMAGQSSTYYLTILPNDDASEGMHSVTVNVKEGTKVIATKTLSMTIPETTGNEITGGSVVEADTEGGVFKNLFSGTTLWIIGDLLLVVIAIFFIKMLFSKRS
ncbi:MAG: putative S-layer protein [Nanoarchaeota archaeon]|nr:putative S-layer protein [Nanoarchaeota archaeon]